MTPEQIEKEFKKLRKLICCNAATGNSLLSATVTLTDEQIKALPTTPIEIIPAPGIGKMILVFNSFWQQLFAGGAYTNLQPGYYHLLTYKNNWGADASGYVTFNPLGANLAQVIPPSLGTVQPDNTVRQGGSGLSNFENVSIYVYMDNAGGGNLTDGNAANTLKVTVYYTIVDL